MRRNLYEIENRKSHLTPDIKEIKSSWIRKKKFLEWKIIMIMMILNTKE